MRFTASIALVAAAVFPAALAQSVNINPVTLTQCASSTITFEGSTGPYYVAVIPANDPCTEDAIAEWYDVEDSSTAVSWYVNQAAGTSIQIYVLDVNNVETWGQVETVGDGDSSCLGGSDAAAPSNDSDGTDSTTVVPPPTTSVVPTSSSSFVYVAPAVATTSAAAVTHSNTGSTHSSNNGGTTAPSNSDEAPVNAANNSANGASSLSASVSLLIGTFAVVAALF